MSETDKSFLDLSSTIIELFTGGLFTFAKKVYGVSDVGLEFYDERIFGVYPNGAWGYSASIPVLRAELICNQTGDILCSASIVNHNSDYTWLRIFIFLFLALLQEIETQMKSTLSPESLGELRNLRTLESYLQLT